jgi:hypothetical protein
MTLDHDKMTLTKTTLATIALCIMTFDVMSTQLALKMKLQLQAERVSGLVSELPVLCPDLVEGLRAEGLEGRGQEEQRGLLARTQRSGWW